MKRGLKLFCRGGGGRLPFVRTQAPMKRGLKHGANPLAYGFDFVRTQAPMKRGLKRYSDILVQRVGIGPNPGPDEEGIETCKTNYQAR